MTNGSHQRPVAVQGAQEDACGMMQLWRRSWSRKELRGGLAKDVTLLFCLRWEVHSVSEEDGELREVFESLKECSAGNAPAVQYVGRDD